MLTNSTKCCRINLITIETREREFIMRVPYTITTESITLFHKGKLFNIPSTYRKFQELTEHLKKSVHDLAFIETIVNVKNLVERLSKGNIRILGDEVYYKQERVVNSLAERLVRLLDDGFEIDPWLNFMENVMLNPSKDSKDRLFTFLEKNNSPFTEDGHFLAFKRIRENYKDIYTGTMDNSPGQIVTMDRANVNPNINETCSRGLHVAASIYLNSFADASNSKTVVCKVNPRDVVSIPVDYNDTKMRVCRYEVLSEVEVGEIKAIEEQNLYIEPKKANENIDSITDLFPDVTSYSLHSIDDSRESWEFVMFSETEQDALYLQIFNKYGEDINRKLFEKELNLDENAKEIFYYIEYPDNRVLNLETGETTPVVETEASKLIAQSFVGVAVGVELFNETAEICIFVKNHAQAVSVITTFNAGKYEINNKMFDLLPDHFTDVDYYVVYENEQYNLESISDCEELLECFSKPDNSGLTFTRNGKTYTASEVLKGVAESGTTHWANKNGIPRSTAQDWVRKIHNS